MTNNFLLKTRLYAAALWRTAAVVRNRRDIADGHDMQPGSSQRAHRGFASRTRTLYFHFHALHAELVARRACGGQSSLLGGVGRALARTLEADRTSRRIADHSPIGIGDGDLRVVEGSRDMHQSMGNCAALLLLLEFLLLFIFASRRRI